MQYFETKNILAKPFVLQRLQFCLNGYINGHVMMRNISSDNKNPS